MSRMGIKASLQAQKLCSFYARNKNESRTIVCVCDMRITCYILVSFLRINVATLS